MKIAKWHILTNERLEDMIYCAKRNVLVVPNKMISSLLRRLSKAEAELGRELRPDWTFGNRGVGRGSRRRMEKRY